MYVQSSSVCVGVGRPRPDTTALRQLSGCIKDHSLRDAGGTCSMEAKLYPLSAMLAHSQDTPQKVVVAKQTHTSCGHPQTAGTHRQRASTLPYSGLCIAGHCCLGVSYQKHNWGYYT